MKNYPRAAQDSGDWVRLHKNDELQGQGTLVTCKAGDLILFDSRTIHGGLVGTGIMDPTKKVNTLSRLSLAVCMTERNRASEEVLKTRVKAFKKGTASNHWPHDFKDHSMGSGGLENNDFQYTPIELTEEIRMLI